MKRWHNEREHSRFGSRRQLHKVHLQSRITETPHHQQLVVMLVVVVGVVGVIEEEKSCDLDTTYLLNTSYTPHQSPRQAYHPIQLHGYKPATVSDLSASVAPKGH